MRRTGTARIAWKRRESRLRTTISLREGMSLVILICIRELVSEQVIMRRFGPDTRVRSNRRWIYDHFMSDLEYKDLRVLPPIPRSLSLGQRRLLLKRTETLSRLGPQP